MTSTRPTSLRFALLCLVAAAILPAYLLLGYNAAELRQRSDKEILNNAASLNRALAREQARVLREARELSQLLTGIPALSDPAQRGFCAKFLSDIHSAMPRYGNLGFATVNGDIYCSASPMPKPVNVADRTYFRRAIETRRFAVGEYLVGRVSGKPSVNVGYPVLDADNRIRGVMFIAVDLGWLRETMLYADIPEHSTVKLLDHRGTLLAAHPDSEAIGTVIDKPELTEAIRKLSARPVAPENPVPVTWFREHHANALYRVGDDTWHPIFVWAELSKTAAIAEIENGFYRYLAWIGTATLLIALLAWLLSNRLVINNIQAVANAAKRFAEGDLSARTGLTHAPAEIASLADAFDDMAAGIQSRELRIMEISSELTRSNRVLRTLSKGNHTLLRAEREDNLLHDMCEVITHTGGFHAAWVAYRQDDAQKPMKAMACSGKLPQDFFDALCINIGNNSQAPGICSRALRSGAIATTGRIPEEPSNRPWRELLEQHGIQSVIALPLKVRDNVIGIMGIYATEPEAFTSNDAELLAELAANLSFGIETIRARIEHRQTESELERLALHDTGSGLPNQLKLRQWLGPAMQQARDKHHPVALLAVHLSRLREIGDILGPRSVNQCIERIAKEISAAAGNDGFVAREGRFTIALVKSGLDLPGAIRLAEKIDKAVQTPFDIGSCPMEIEARIGIAMFPGHATDPDSLVGRASLAAQHALSTGRNYSIIETNPEEAALKRLTMLGELRSTISKNELLMHYQPKIEAASGKIVGAEALVRWQHPVRGMIPPGDFIPLAEQTGLIRPITQEVLRMVTSQIHAWQQEHGLALPVAVNLSAHNLHDPELPGQIDGLVSTWGIERRLLQLEITESALMRDPDESMKVLSNFSQSGMQLFIDDFGTGYSSLAYLATLPVHALKIDKSFVTNMVKNAQHRAIARTIISLAQTLKLRTVAEGVETIEQAEILARLGCNELQGYMFSKPLPQDQFVDWALRHR